MEDEFYGAAYKGSNSFPSSGKDSECHRVWRCCVDDYAERGIDLNGNWSGINRRHSF